MQPVSVPAQTASRVYEVAVAAKPEAIVLHCSDPRFQQAFEQFVHQELRLDKGKFIPLIIGGGPSVLAHPEQLPKEFKFIKDRFEFYRENFPTIRRVVLIHHEDCDYYDSLRSKLLGFLGSHLPTSSQDKWGLLSAIAKPVSHLLSRFGLSIEIYQARFTDATQTKIVFTQPTR
jgi:hypothetical protein